MIKKFFIGLFILILCYIPSFSQSYSSLDKIENYMFGMTYNDQDDKIRIERLEKNIYGTVQKGNIKSRLEHLSKDISADTIGQEITPSKYTEFEEKEDSTVDYPIIDEFEKQIFNKKFSNKSIENRLSNLEQKVFNQTYKNDDLNKRTERLKIAIDIPKQDNSFNYDIDERNNLTDYNYNEFSADNGIPAFKTNKKYDANVGKILTALEKKIFKKSYSNESEEERIERLEEKMFSTSFPQDSIESRLERLAVAYQASKTSKKYDTNKFSQHMATAMQVGMFLLMILAMVL